MRACARTAAWRSTSVSALSSTCWASRRRSPSSCTCTYIGLLRSLGWVAQGSMLLARARMAVGRQHYDSHLRVSPCRDTGATCFAAPPCPQANRRIPCSRRPTERSKERRCASVCRSAASRASSSSFRCRRLSASSRFSSAAISPVTLYARACVPGADGAAAGGAPDDGGRGGGCAVRGSCEGQTS